MTREFIALFFICGWDAFGYRTPNLPASAGWGDFHLGGFAAEGLQ